MTDRKEFYKKLLEDFLKEQWIYADLTDADFEKLPEWETNTFAYLYSDIEEWSKPGNEAWEEWRAQMLEESKKKLENDFKIFGEQLYQKHYTTPGGLCGELARMIAEAREILPHDFKVALRHMAYYEYDGIETETIFVWVVFIDEKLLETINKK